MEIREIKLEDCRGEFLRNEGYSVLVIGFYMWKGMPKEMYHIPVEYVENAVKWLKNEKGFNKIGIMGTSTESVNRMERILKENNYPYKVKKIIYETRNIRFY